MLAEQKQQYAVYLRGQRALRELWPCVMGMHGPPECMWRRPGRLRTCGRRLIRHEPALAATLLQCKSSVAAFKAAPSSCAAGRTAVHVVAQKRVSKKQQVGAAAAAAAGLGGSAVGQAA